MGRSCAPAGLRGRGRRGAGDGTCDPAGTHWEGLSLLSVRLVLPGDGASLGRTRGTHSHVHFHPFRLSFLLIHPLLTHLSFTFSSIHPSIHLPAHSLFIRNLSINKLLISPPMDASHYPPIHTFTFSHLLTAHPFSNSLTPPPVYSWINHPSLYPSFSSFLHPPSSHPAFTDARSLCARGAVQDSKGSPV